MPYSDSTLVLDPDALSVRRLAIAYWRAASRLRGRGDVDLSPTAAVRDLHVLARSCCHNRLRRAAGRALAALARHDGIADGGPGPEAA
ncbi:MAG TPA: hypothetical protein VMW52_11420 [Phycisphaerae bacterium]|nr:hypothetical protein [Phycisphaerae bacterium]